MKQLGPKSRVLWREGEVDEAGRLLFPNWDSFSVDFLVRRVCVGDLCLESVWALRSEKFGDKREEKKSEK